MFAKFFKDSDWVHACPTVDTPQKREEWTHQTHSAMVTDIEYRN